MSFVFHSEGQYKMSSFALADNVVGWMEMVKHVFVLIYVVGEFLLSNMTALIWTRRILCSLLS